MKKSLDLLNLFERVAHSGDALLGLDGWCMLGLLGSVNGAERFPEAGLRVRLVLDEHHLEQGLVEKAAVRVIDLPVQPVHLAEQRGCAGQEPGDAAQLSPTLG